MTRRVSRVIALMAVGAVVVSGGCKRADADGLIDTQAEEIVRAHNAWRRRAGVPSLRWAADLAARAQERARYLAAH